jgi:hypothetical protein
LLSISQKSLKRRKVDTSQRETSILGVYLRCALDFRPDFERDVQILSLSIKN